MKWSTLFLGAFLAFAVDAVAEDKISAEIAGTAEVEGINFEGMIVGADVSSYARHAVSGKVNVVADEGEVHRVETYTEWSAENGVRGRVWEKLYVSGGTFTGWTERLIQTPFQIVFSRTVIDGDIEQEIKPDGSGYVEWTVTGGDNAIASDDDSGDDSTDVDTSADSGSDLPTVEIEEEGEFNGISDRRIDIDMDDGRPSISFRDNGFELVNSNSVLDADEVYVNQKLKLEGDGKGDLGYDPDARKDEGSGNQTNDGTGDGSGSDLPFATPTPTPIPSDISTGVVEGDNA